MLGDHPEVRQAMLTGAPFIDTHFAVEDESFIEVDDDQPDEE